MRLSIIALAAIVALLAAAPADTKPISGRPAAICTSPVQLVTSAATKVVGKGTAVSCNEAALVSALASGGVIHFNCGPKPVTIAISSQININKSVDTIIDGNHLVTLDGKGVTRILSLNNGNYNSNTPKLTVQRLRFINAHSQGSGTQPTNGGGAIYRFGGSLDVIDSDFGHNQAPSPGQDIAGGAIYSIGGGFTRISGSIFYANKASNGGAIGNLGNDMSVYNSYIGYNKATGTGGNPGGGGNGGGISMDGKGRSATLCGVALVDNVANKFGGAMFRTSYTGLEPNNFDHILVDGNQIVEAGNGLAGGLYIQGGRVVLTNSAITRNKASGFAGIFLAPMDHDNLFKNVVIAENTAYTGLGGGIDCDSDVTGTFDHITVARNHAPGPAAFGGGITGCTGITLSNSAVVDNTEGNEWNPLNCFAGPLKDGGHNIQGPKVRASGQTDAKCTSNSVFVPAGTSSPLNTRTFCVTVKGGYGAQCMKKIPGLGGKIPKF